MMACSECNQEGHNKRTCIRASPITVQPHFAPEEFLSPTVEMTTAEFWNIIKRQNKDGFKSMMQYIMEEYGTALHCNRFAIGNCHEYAIGDVIKATGLEVAVMQNEKRHDIVVKGFRKFSIKYCTAGDIKLHNSINSCNKDDIMVDTLLVTPTQWWFLVAKDIEDLGINIKDYVVNTGDGLILKKKLLTELVIKQYPYMLDLDITVDKKRCKNQEINRLLYDMFKIKLNSHNEV